MKAHLPFCVKSSARIEVPPESHGMVGTFACPECGTQVPPQGRAPGRKIQCAECGTVMEVPYLPRASSASSTIRRQRISTRWAWSILAFAALLVLVAAIIRFAGSRERTSESRIAARCEENAKAAEAAGEFAQAVAEIESALRVIPATETSRRDSLQKHRDRLALRAAETRLSDYESELAILNAPLEPIDELARIWMPTRHSNRFASASKPPS